MTRKSTTLKRAPAQLRKHAEQMLRAMVVGATMGMRQARAILVRNTPTDQGQLRASWRVHPGHMVGTKIVMPFVDNDAPHAGIVERGARPHPVSKAGFFSIFHWVKRHGMGNSSPRKFQRGGRARIQGPQHVEVIYGFPFTGPDVPAARIALSIVRKIRARGQKATYFVRNSRDEIRATVLAAIRGNMDRAHQLGGGG